MIIAPEFSHGGFVISTAHPLGCFKNVDLQIDAVLGLPGYAGPKRALVLGASSGYGLASAISLIFGAGADVIGIALARGPVAGEPSTGSADYWNCRRLQQRAAEHGRRFTLVPADVFSDSVRQRIIDLVRTDAGGALDAVIYSIASSRRIDPKTGQIWYSTLKGMKRIEGPTINMENGRLQTQVLEPATPEELEATVKVMGGEDWQLWIEALHAAGVLSPRCKTTAYTYIGPPLMHDIYTLGALGHAKRHLEKTADTLHDLLSDRGGEAISSSMKAIVSKASIFIPTYPVYGSVLFKVMKQLGSHESTIEHTHRLLSTMLFGTSREVDPQRRLRPDSREMASAVQDKVSAMMPLVTQHNLTDLTDFEFFRQEFLQTSGFALSGIDYGQDVDVPGLAGI
jgi:enoyl-[acyl-carrier protein] reductase/trans-2-enoyl-CoA reductase (NAD+)